MKNKPIPNWAKWIAKDEDEKCWAYSVEPLQFHKGWYENEVGQYQQVNCPEELMHVRWQDAIKKL